MELVQIAMRSLVGFIVLLLLTRIIGRKQISELTFFDYVTGITIGAIAGSLTIDTRIPILSGLYALAFWAILTLVTSAITRASIPARKLINSEPVMVIRDGQILEDALQSRKYDVNTLLMQLREQEVFDPSEVAVGIIETDGKLSIHKAAKAQPVAPAAVPKTYQNQELIIDGVLQYENINDAGVTPDWLMDELRKQDITDPSTVTLAMITPQGSLYVDKNKDNVPGSEKDSK